MTEFQGRLLETLGQDGELVLHRGAAADGAPVLVRAPRQEHPAPAILARLEHEYDLRAELDPAWAVCPRALVRQAGKLMLVLDDPGGELLESRLETRLETGLGPALALNLALPLAIALAQALGQAHARGLIHKDLCPAHILIKENQVRLTGFGLASRLPRERQALAPPEIIAGTLAYLAPEQTGRMNRSVDARSDLYALGVILYRMLTGELPFTAASPMEWVHCHIARRPVPPAERVPGLPGALSAIVMKCLAKTAEERYQTAAGVAADLLRCLARWDAAGLIEPFAPGMHDLPDQLRIPEKLYGREGEVATLLAAFDRVVAQGRPELVLVSGYSGIGKSAVVNELHKALVPTRGLFAAGKFDQYQRDIPYATLAQAFQGLIRQILGKGEAELARWRDELAAALAPNGRLMVNLVPELRLIIGDQPPVADLPPQDVEYRFRQVFRRFISVFARPEHPLALFLDDLQWLDSATLTLLADLATSPELHHLLLVGAYRDNEVDAAHPLMRSLDAIRQAGGTVHEIVLAPLAPDDVGRLVADALRCTPEAAEPLARLVSDKTGGNPFFTIEFLTALAEEKLLGFDPGQGKWGWDLERIRAKGYTDNVGDLMVGKLIRLPQETQGALQHFACLGHAADIATLGLAFGQLPPAAHAALWEAVRAGLVTRQGDDYAFLHDRVQEAAYSLIAKEARAATHLRIGRILAASFAPEAIAERIFDVVGQLNRGCDLVDTPAERERIAELNLMAGRRAQASTAYAAALAYLATGAGLLADDGWECSHEHHDLAFALEFHRAECEYLTGQLASAEERLAALAKRAASTVERANLVCLRMDMYTTLDRSGDAVEVCLDYLRDLGIAWSPHPTEDELRREYERIGSRLGERTIEALIDLPLMDDPASFATIDVLTKVLPPALFTDGNLASLTICRAVSLSLERGNCDASCFAYVMLGRIAGPRFSDYPTGFRFGQLGYDLVEKRGLRRFEASTIHCFAVFVLRWMKHVRTCRDLMAHAFEAANRIGDLEYGAFTCNNLNSNLLFAGDPLPEVQREAEQGLAFAEKARFGLVIDIITTQRALIRMLRGLTPTFGCLGDGPGDELRMEEHLSGNPVLAIATCWYWIRKLQARYLAGHYGAAMAAAARAQPLLWTSVAFLEEAEYHFYGALARAACCDGASAGERPQHLEALAAHHRQLGVWAENCPENFANRDALVGAEIARLEGRELEAMRLYERAIRSARDNGFVHQEALANELAARFYLAGGFDKIADAYRRDAHYGYLRWGALGKVREMEAAWPQLAEPERSGISPTAATIGAPVEQLDVATVVKASQAVSSDIVLDRLTETLMRIALEHAGADRGLLILPEAETYRIAARATLDQGQLQVILEHGPPTGADLPEALLHYVARTHETVLVDDTSAPNPFPEDPYLLGKASGSILCLPLVKQARLLGILYLENNLAPRAFTRKHLAVLELLASQAAISLENASLYAGLQEREARIRRLVDANIIGIFFWNLAGDVTAANDAFLDMVGYSRQDLESGSVSWAEITPPECQAADQRAAAEIMAAGSCRSYEKEYVRQDGSRVPVLIGATLFEGSKDEGVAFVLDLSARKRVEAALSENRERLAAILGSALDAVISIDGEQRVILFNGAAERMFGYPAEEIIGQPLDRLIPERFRAVHREHVRQFGESGATRREMGGAIEVVGRRANGEEFAVDAAISRAEAGGQTLFTVMLRDISERKRLEAERQARQVAEAANRAKSEFLANMSHELRTPLNAILGYAQLLKREPSLSERQAGGLDTIELSGQHLLTLINDLLDLAKIEAGKLELSPQPLGLSRFLSVVADIVRVRAEEKGLGFSLAVAPDLPPVVQADEQRLRQVLLNLLGNAVIFTAHGEVRLQVECRARAGTTVTVRFAVTDSGVGIAAAALETIFQPFEQVGAADRRAAGTGLGLSISRQLVRLMGSDIRVESTPGRGSRFWFDLTLGVVAGEAAATAPAPRLQPIIGYGGPRRRVLIADDVASNRALLADLLGGLGFEIAAAENGAEAVERAQAEKPDLVLMDLVMPVMSGREAIRSLRGMAGLERLPIIVLSASTDGKAQGGDQATGADAFLPKPIEQGALLQTIGNLLGLTWTHAQTGVTPGAAPAAAPAPAMAVPPPKDLEVLHRLAQAGDMREVSNWAAHMIAIDTAYRPFGERLQRLAKAYQSKAILALVEERLQESGLAAARGKKGEGG